MARVSDREAVANVAKSFLDKEINRFNATNPSVGVTGVGAHSSRQAAKSDRVPGRQFRS